VLFLVLDRLVQEIEPQLLSLDERLNEIQVTLMTSSPPQIHDEIVNISRTLTEYVQGMSWYGSDLDDVAGIIERLPGMRDGAAERFSHHRDRVSRMGEAAQNYRGEGQGRFRPLLLQQQ
jgi:CorA-like Mg2+ transporter protein